jgi:hypothetical protein
MADNPMPAQKVAKPQADDAKTRAPRFHPTLPDTPMARRDVKERRLRPDPRASSGG